MFLKPFFNWPLICTLGIFAIKPIILLTLGVVSVPYSLCTYLVVNVSLGYLVKWTWTDELQIRFCHQYVFKNDNRELLLSFHFRCYKFFKRCSDFKTYTLFSLLRFLDDHVWTFVILIKLDLLFASAWSTHGLCLVKCNCLSPAPS